jgi:hypothetical protein
MLVAWFLMAPSAAADPNNQSTQQLCRDADYADLHPTICSGPFTLGTGGGGHGGNSGGGLLGTVTGLLGHLGGLL